METATPTISLKRLPIGNYLIELVKVEDFKKYYYENLEYFSNTAFNSYLKAVDIPPKFFKENPVETQKELLDNREVFVKEHKKYFDKVIVVARVKLDNRIINACRMVEKLLIVMIDLKRLIRLQINLSTVLLKKTDTFLILFQEGI